MATVPHLALSSTLRHVAETKLTKLGQRRAELDEFWRKNLDDETVQFRDVDRVRRLLEAMKDRGHKFHDEQWPCSMANFLDHAEKNPFVRPSQVAAWGESLLLELEQKRARYQVTELFSKLVLQWIQNPVAVESLTDESESAQGPSELREQLTTWTSYAFEEKYTNKNEIMAYLDDLFLGRQQRSVLNESPFDQLRKAIAGFDEITIDPKAIRIAVHSLLKEDLFTGEKRDALEDLKSRDIVMGEIADALRSDLSALDWWSWQSSAIPVHLRRHINGKFRVYMDEEIYEAIFIQIVGSFWAVFLKRALKSFAMSSAWLEKSASTRLSKDHIEKRTNFLGKSAELNQRNDTINTTRWRTYCDRFFLSQLPSSMENGTKGDYNDESDENDTTDMTPSEIKQSMLRLISTEILVQKHIHGSATYFQTDFQWFGPSVPHSTLLALFEFFHVPPKWIAFFQKFMQPTLQVEEEGVYGEPKKRVRGIPISHTLSTVFGELLLFVLDFAVNQETQGCNIYRFFDDIHFWGQPESCAKAWNTIQNFTHIMGLALNEEKSGSFQCSLTGRDTILPDRLPTGDVHWGFLKLVGDGEWQLDQENLMHHISEMARQLKYCDSVLSFIHAYNTYMRFFINNAGHHAFCLGQKHAIALVDMVVQVQKAVAEILSDSKHTDVISFVREKIQRSMKLDLVSSDLSDAFFFFPTELGGLGLSNPLDHLISLRRCSPMDPENIIITVKEKEKQEYEKALESFEEGMVHDIPLNAPETPLSFDEYLKFPEDGSRVWNEAYKELQDMISIPSIMLTDDIETAKCRLERSEDINISMHHSWSIQMYGAEVLAHMGRLAFGERDLMPIGLIKVLSKERFRWQA